MKNKIILTAVLLASIAFGAITLSQSIEINSLKVTSFNLNVISRTASVGLEPQMVVDGNVMYRGDVTYIKIGKEETTILGATPFAEMGIDDTSLSSALTGIIEVGLKQQGYQLESVTIDWPVKTITTNVFEISGGINETNIVVSYE